MPTKNLLLCFDAFGTLFKPRTPVHHQYAEVARTFGLHGFSDEDVLKSFKTAFKQEAKQNPNYGKANGLNAEKWWSSIIQNTFQPLIGPEQKLPKELVPRLLNRFWCDEGYTLFSDVQPFLQQIRDLHHAADHRVIVGVITNSDDRVPSILTSLGLRVGSLRFGSSDADHSTGSANDANDIDFSVMSYDVGHEKPDSRIFQAGEQMLREILEAQNLSAAADFDASTWSKVYIGDEYEKDVVGAVGAGWNAVLIDRENSRPSGGLEWMDCRQPGDLFDALHSSNALGFSSLAKLTEWLRPGP